jgi:nucleotide-binding universal stress UspA family protein
LEFAYRQAFLRELPLTVMYCVPFPGAPDLPLGLIDDLQPGLEEYRCALAESVAGMNEKFPDVRAHLQLAHGSADLRLRDATATLDLIVVGRHHAGPTDLLGLGSFAASVVEGASCPVMPRRTLPGWYGRMITTGHAACRATATLTDPRRRVLR